MAHPYVRLWRFTSTNITFRSRCRNRKAAAGRHAGINLMPSNAGICTGGVGSTRAFGPPLPRASSCSCHCSTTTQPVHRAFCPPRAAYRRPTAGEPRPLPPIDSLLETGKVLALNFPVGMNPGLARILGVMLKLDFQRAVLQRIPQITAQPERIWRDLLFVCDEYTPLRPSAKRIRPGTSARSRCRDRRS